MFRKHLLFLFVLIASICFVMSCTRDYVTGKRTFNLISESQEIAMGREADPQIVAEFGLYKDDELAAYVNQIGQAIARSSDRPNLEYTFRVVDSPIVNAFALPGGWIYFTRGILAHFNSEDELAGVMGHEIGHVAARHGAEQLSKAQLAQVGLGVGSALSEEFRQLSGLAQAGVGLLFLKFGRGQESESDLLGVKYSTKLGYDAHQMAGFFRTIGKLTEQSGQSIPTFLSTHPDPGDREVRVNQLADEWQAKIAYTPKNTDRSEYLRKIDGIVYGPDPRQGFVENNMFYHPDLQFQFPVPKNWTLVNTPSKVDIISTDKKAGIQLSLARAASPEAAANKFVRDFKAKELSRVARRVHGYHAIRVISTVSSNNNLLKLLSYFIEKDNNIYVFHGYTTSSLYSKFEGMFETVMQGFDRLRNQAALRKKPLRVRIVKASRAGTLSSTLKRFKMKESMFDELAILNGMKLEDQVARGEYIKIVRE